MKARFLVHPAVPLLISALTLVASSANAQSPDLPRADAWGALGWRHGLYDDEESYSTRDGRNAQASAGAGFYYTPHLKIEFDTGTPTSDTRAGAEQIVNGTIQTFRYVHLTYETWGVGVIQTYDFLTNAWFTPFVGAGIEVGSEKREEYLEGVSVFDLSGRQQGSSSQDRRELSSERRSVLRPLAIAGFKAYFSRRVFFRTDSRVVVHDGVSGVSLRLGLGVDF